MTVKVGVIGYGTIGTRLAYGVSLQKDMDLAGVADVGPTLSVRSLKARGMPYKLYCMDKDGIGALENAGIPVSGTVEDLLGQVDIVLDAAPGGIGVKNRQLYARYDLPAIFQGGEKGEVGDVFFHGCANYEKGFGKKYLVLTSCNTTGLVRTVDCLDRAFGIEKVAVTIVRRCADPGDTYRGYVDLARVDPVPTHQAVDLMKIMPHIKATGVLVHVPITHGHIISVVATPKKRLAREEALKEFAAHSRIQIVRIADGFSTNTSLFQFARFAHRPGADMYEVAVYEETVALIGNELVYAIYVPQEAVTIPETIDGIRASLKMQAERLKAVSLTDRHLGLEPKKALY
jgi:glyceraldehyde-3-phosphate dehydrogenase (NAD(P))